MLFAWRDFTWLSSLLLCIGFRIVTIYRLVKMMVWWCVGGWAWVCVRFGRSAGVHIDFFGILLVHRTGFIRNYPFSAKNIPFKMVEFKTLKSNGPIVYVSMIKWPKIFRSKVVEFKSLDSGHPPNHISKTNRSKIFRSKRPKARMDEGFWPPFFGHFFGHL